MQIGAVCGSKRKSWSLINPDPVTVVHVCRGHSAPDCGFTVPGSCQKRASTSQRRYSGWRSLSTRSGPAETGRIVPRCEDLPEEHLPRAHAYTANKAQKNNGPAFISPCIFVLVSPVFVFGGLGVPSYPVPIPVLFLVFVLNICDVPATQP